MSGQWLSGGFFTISGFWRVSVSSGFFVSKKSGSGFRVSERPGCNTKVWQQQGKFQQVSSYPWKAKNAKMVLWLFEFEHHESTRSSIFSLPESQLCFLPSWIGSSYFKGGAHSNVFQGLQQRFQAGVNILQPVTTLENQNGTVHSIEVIIVMHCLDVEPERGAHVPDLQFNILQASQMPSIWNLRQLQCFVFNDGIKTCGVPLAPASSRGRHRTKPWAGNAGPPPSPTGVLPTKRKWLYPASPKAWPVSWGISASSVSGRVYLQVWLPLR